MLKWYKANKVDICSYHSPGEGSQRLPFFCLRAATEKTFILIVHRLRISTPWSKSVHVDIKVVDETVAKWKITLILIQLAPDILLRI